MIHSQEMGMPLHLQGETLRKYQILNLKCLRDYVVVKANMIPASIAAVETRAD